MNTNQEDLLEEWVNEIYDLLDEGVDLDEIVSSVRITVDAIREDRADGQPFTLNLEQHDDLIERGFHCG